MSMDLRALSAFDINNDDRFTLIRDFYMDTSTSARMKLRKFKEVYDRLTPIDQKEAYDRCDSFLRSMLGLRAPVPGAHPRLDHAPQISSREEEVRLRLPTLGKAINEITRASQHGSIKLSPGLLAAVIEAEIASGITVSNGELDDKAQLLKSLIKKHSFNVLWALAEYYNTQHEKGYGSIEQWKKMFSTYHDNIRLFASDGFIHTDQTLSSKDKEFGFTALAYIPTENKAYSFVNIVIQKYKEYTASTEKPIRYPSWIRTSFIKNVINKERAWTAANPLNLKYFVSLSPASSVDQRLTGDHYLLYKKLAMLGVATPGIRSFTKENLLATLKFSGYVRFERERFQNYRQTGDVNKVLPASAVVALLRHTSQVLEYASQIKMLSSNINYLNTLAFQGTWRTSFTSILQEASMKLDRRPADLVTITYQGTVIEGWSMPRGEKLADDSMDAFLKEFLAEHTEAQYRRTKKWHVYDPRSISITPTRLMKKHLDEHIQLLNSSADLSMQIKRIERFVSRINAEIDAKDTHYAIDLPSLLRVRYGDTQERYPFKHKYLNNLRNSYSQWQSVVASDLDLPDTAQIHLDITGLLQLTNDLASHSGGSAIPVNGSIGSPFGRRKDPFTGEWKQHTGTDIVITEGTPIKTIAGGKVTHAGWMGDYGLVVEIENSGEKYRYCHCQRILVRVGDLIKKEQLVATVGKTGKATGAHLHIERIVDGQFKPLIDTNTNLFKVLGASYVEQQKKIEEQKNKKPGAR